MFFYVNMKVKEGEIYILSYKSQYLRSRNAINMVFGFINFKLKTHFIAY
jgi:hypothetical protein